MHGTGTHAHFALFRLSSPTYRSTSHRSLHEVEATQQTESDHWHYFACSCRKFPGQLHNHPLKMLSSSSARFLNSLNGTSTSISCRLLSSVPSSLPINPAVTQKAAIPTVATLKPISASIRSNVTNVSSIKKLCCRKGCLKCVDTPSYRERTVGSASRRR